MKRFLVVLTCLLCIGLGVFAAWYAMVTKPMTQRVKPPVSSPLVTVSSAEKGTAMLNVAALGTIKAAQATTVKVRVSGQVEELGAHFEAGDILQKGDLIVQLDTANYDNTLALQESALASAKADYDLEMGQQRVARTELEQLNKIVPNTVSVANINTAIALREPQLAQAKAAVQSAEANLKQAQLDLERTRVVAPYNALVVERTVSLGNQASTSDSLGSIVGTDTYYIEAGIPLDKMHSLGLHIFDGNKVRIYSNSGVEREGKVLHAIANIDDTTRMGRVLIAIDDPLGLHNGEPALLLGDHVRVELEAGELDDVAVLPRSALRANDTVWILGKPTDDGIEGQFSLDIRNVTIIWKDTEKVFITDGLRAGDQIIVSPLGAAIHGMPVRLPTASKAMTRKAQAREGSRADKRPDGPRPDGARPDEAAKGPRPDAPRLENTDKVAEGVNHE